MKKLAVVVFVLVAVFFLTGSVFAEDNPTQIIWEDTLQRLEAVELSNFSFADMIKQGAEGEFELSISNVLQRIGKMLFGELKNNIGLLIKMLVLSILAGVLCNLQQNMPGDSVTEIGFLVCISVVAALSATVVSDMVALADSTIDSLVLFMQSLMPVVGSLAADSTGAVMSFYPLLFISMQSFTYICKSVFLPLIMVITALSVVNAMSSRFHISRLIEFARQGIKWGIGLLLTIFVGILSVRGFTAGAAGLAGRTVKYALCNFVPLVGGVLAESAASIVNSLKVIRSVVGFGGVIAAVGLCAAPLLKMLAVSVLYRFAAGVAEPATDKRIIALLMDLSGNITLVLTIVLMVCVMFIISVAMLCVLL